MNPSQPDRRSDAGLQEILDSLIGDQEHVLAGNLPDGELCVPCGDQRRKLIPVLQAYERKHDLLILEEGEFDGLKVLCQEHPDLELGAKDLFNFLSYVPFYFAIPKVDLLIADSFPSSARGATLILQPCLIQCHSLLPHSVHFSLRRPPPQTRALVNPLEDIPIASARLQIPRAVAIPRRKRTRMRLSDIIDSHPLLLSIPKPLWARRLSRLHRTEIPRL